MRACCSLPAQAWQLSDEQLSVLLGLVVEVHAASVQRRLTISASFELLKDMLLRHAVQR